MTFPVRKADVLWREAENEVIVLDQGAGKVHQLNQTAADIWRWCDGQKSLADIVVSMSREYSVPEADVEPDVTRTVNELVALGLLELLSQAGGLAGGSGQT